MKKLLLRGGLSVSLWVLAGSVQAQVSSADIVVVRGRDYVTSASVFVTRGEGKTEKMVVDASSLSLDKRMTAVSEAYCKVIAKLYQEGYILQNSAVITDQTDGGAVTYLFVKSPVPAGR